MSQPPRPGAARWLPGGAPAEQAGEPATAGEAAPSGESAATTPTPANGAPATPAPVVLPPPVPDEGRVRRGLFVPAWAAGLLFLLLAAAAAAIVALAIDNGKGASKPTAPTSTASGARPPASRSTTSSTRPQVHPTRDPFDVGNVRFAVFVAPHQRWTQFAKQSPPGAGQRWLLISVRTRNLGRTGFDPLKLPYSVTAGGKASVVYSPDASHGSGPKLHGPAAPTTTGILSQTELAFAVPAAASNLRLHFPAGAGRTEPIEVPVDRP